MAKRRRNRSKARESPRSNGDEGKLGGFRAPNGHVVVVVMGDVGRSPRMQYHCVSLASHGAAVTLVGQSGEPCVAAVEDNPLVQKALYSPMAGFGKVWRFVTCGLVSEETRAARLAYVLLYAPVKLIFMALSLSWVLLFGMPTTAGRFVLPAPSAVLVQNPPALPALAVVYFVCVLCRGMRLVIDWHNLGFTMLSLRLGDSHPAVWAARAYEAFFARRAHGHMCVTRAMAGWLRDNFSIGEVNNAPLAVLYDRPPEFFRKLEVAEAHALFARLQADTGPLAAAAADVFPSEFGAEAGGGWTLADASEQAATMITETVAGGRIALRRDRPALIVSSTSWTPDEDFSLLFDAIQIVDDRAADAREACADDENDDDDGEEQGMQKKNGKKKHIKEKRRKERKEEKRKKRALAGTGAIPHIVLCVTGKGPQRAMYEERIRGLGLSSVSVSTMWLAQEDYPRLLGACDLGVSLHTSTSGLDLPMKVVDMFGCELPCCAVKFACLPELVRHGRNGLTFSSAQELATQICRLFRGFPFDDGLGEDGDGHDFSLLGQLAEGAAEFQKSRWAANWDRVAAPLLLVGGGKKDR